MTILNDTENAILASLACIRFKLRQGIEQITTKQDPNLTGHTWIATALGEVEGLAKEIEDRTLIKHNLEDGGY